MWFYFWHPHQNICCKQGIKADYCGTKCITDLVTDVIDVNEADYFGYSFILFFSTVHLEEKLKVCIIDWAHTVQSMYILHKRADDRTICLVFFYLCVCVCLNKWIIAFLFTIFGIWRKLGMNQVEHYGFETVINL